MFLNLNLTEISLFLNIIAEINLKNPFMHCPQIGKIVVILNLYGIFYLETSRF
jgi:hypothetical protein